MLRQLLPYETNTVYAYTHTYTKYTYIYVHAYMHQLVGLEKERIVQEAPEGRRQRLLRGLLADVKAFCGILPLSVSLCLSLSVCLSVSVSLCLSLSLSSSSSSVLLCRSGSAGFRS